SRMDRIYIKHSLFESCRNWNIEYTAMKSDHRLVGVQLACRPEVRPGHGRFSLPLYLFKTRRFMREVRRLGIELQNQLKKLEHKPRQGDKNIQVLWHKFKHDIVAYAR
ncbi:hypothetical protein DFH09DRAFT_845650, partial [Mycena vulgaris]